MSNEAHAATQDKKGIQRSNFNKLLSFFSVDKKNYDLFTSIQSQLMDAYTDVFLITDRIRSMGKVV